LNVEANPMFVRKEGEPIPSNMGVNFNFFRKGKEAKFKIVLDVVVNSNDSDFKKSEYRIRIKMESYLEFDSSVSEKDISSLLVPNGLAMTYSIARGIVGQATGTSLHGKFLLPAVNFIELIKQNIEAKKKKTKTTKNKKP
jgi:preprotein translocase subunit SecB